MSAALDRAIAAIGAASRRKMRDLDRRDARRFVSGEWPLDRVILGVTDIPPEDVIPALREMRDGQRYRIRTGHWTASTALAAEAHAALIAVRYLRRFGRPERRRAA